MIQEARLYTYIRLFIVDNEEFYTVHCIDDEDETYIVKQLDHKPLRSTYSILPYKPKISDKFRHILKNPQDYFLISPTYIHRT